MLRFANPARFMRLSAALLPWFAAATAMCFGVGLYLALVVSPPDYQQGDSVRIMYVHVPAAAMAEIAYGFLALASAMGLIWRHPLADVGARAAAPIGACFALICLVTGSLWGEPMWGTWWVWDARLTSMLVLFLLYLGYLALINAFDEPERGLRAGQILALVGVIDLVIVKFSVNWWNTLHQPASLLRMDGSAPTISGPMLWPLLIMIVAFSLFFVTVMLLRMRTMLVAAKLRAQRLAELEDDERAGIGAFAQEQRR